MVEVNKHILEHTPQKENIKTREISENFTNPNTRMLPKQVKELVSEGSKVAVVPGDGTCLIGTTTTHIEGDTENRVQLSKDINTHIAMHREVYLPNIEADSPNWNKWPN